MKTSSLMNFITGNQRVSNWSVRMRLSVNLTRYPTLSFVDWKKWSRLVVLNRDLKIWGPRRQRKRRLKRFRVPSTFIVIIPTHWLNCENWANSPGFEFLTAYSAQALTSTTFIWVPHMSTKCVYCATASTSPFCKLSDLTTRLLLASVYLLYNKKMVIYSAVYFKFFVLGVRGPTKIQTHTGAFAFLTCSVICYSCHGNFYLQACNCPRATLWITIWWSVSVLNLTTWKRKWII